MPTNTRIVSHYVYPLPWSLTQSDWAILAVALLFSGEENFGRYLDLYAHHTHYNNLKNLPRHISYVQYLDILSKVNDDGAIHGELSSQIKLTKDYERCAS